MPDVKDYLNGYIYHMVHFDNLQSIFQQGVLLSKEQVAQKKISYESIAFRGDEETSSDEKKRRKHAEVLVPDSLPLDLIQAISVNSRDMAKAVNQLIASASYRTSLRVPFSTYKPALFFQ